MTKKNIEFYRDRQSAMDRSRWEVYVTDAERAYLKLCLRERRKNEKKLRDNG